ncbi:MAG: cytochrome c maturation protein CcmE [Nitrospirae bacterium]|nr:MAG: cytochrome c maturation protein CcmE [Nitrospirota bacterium]
MTGLYIRWGIFVLLAIILSMLVVRHYEAQLATVSPSDLILSPSTGSFRVQGMVKSGTLKGDVEQGAVQFELVDDAAAIRVQYHGPPPENLRELKTVVMIGTWDATARVFRAHEIALVSNYGFVASAYLLTFIPIGVFLFSMSRKVVVLMQAIKDSKLYEPEG